MTMKAKFIRLKDSELQECLKNSSILEKRIRNRTNPCPTLADIDRAWDGIIFLLTGNNCDHTDSPLIKIIFSGQHIDDNQDLGCGPVHYLTPKQVIELNEKISNIHVKDLKPRFNYQRMNQLNVYPGRWDGEEDTFEYLANEFKNLQKIFSTATKNEEAIVSYLE